MKLETLTNFEKEIVLRLLVERRFDACQHRLKVLADQGCDIGLREVVSINTIIEKLNLKSRSLK